MCVREGEGVREGGQREREREIWIKRVSRRYDSAAEAVGAERDRESLLPPKHLLCNRDSGQRCAALLHATPGSPESQFAIQHIVPQNN